MITPPLVKRKIQIDDVVELSESDVKMILLKHVIEILGLDWGKANVSFWMQDDVHSVTGDIVSQELQTTIRLRRIEGAHENEN